MDTGEAGVNIEGITFVVDAMYGAQPVMDPLTGLEVPETVPISQQVVLQKHFPNPGLLYHLIASSCVHSVGGGVRQAFGV